MRGKAHRTGAQAFRCAGDAHVRGAGLGERAAHRLGTGDRAAARDRGGRQDRTKPDPSRTKTITGSGPRSPAARAKFPPRSDRPCPAGHCLRPSGAGRIHAERSRHEDRSEYATRPAYWTAVPSSIGSRLPPGVSDPEARPALEAFPRRWKPLRPCEARASSRTRLMSPGVSDLLWQSAASSVAARDDPRWCRYHCVQQGHAIHKSVNRALKRVLRADAAIDCLVSCAGHRTGRPSGLFLPSSFSKNESCSRRSPWSP